MCERGEQVPLDRSTNWRARPPLALSTHAITTLLLAICAAGILAATALACEGTGGPPSSPTEEETNTCNKANPNVELLCTGEPVNNASGNLTEEQTDLSLGGRGPKFHIVRAYNSQVAAAAKEAGPWGYGWSGPYDARLELNKTLKTATVHQESGTAAVFYEVSGSWTQGGWTQARLITSGTDYIYTLPDQSSLEFNEKGLLTKEADRFGNSLSFAYNKSNELETVTDAAKRTLTFKYDKEGQVESVEDPLKRKITYTYSSEQLASVTIEGKVRWEFEYATPHLLKKITDGRKHATSNEFDGSHRVIKQTIAGHERKFKYGSTPDTETTITEPNGSETYETFNSALEPTKITRAKGKAEETSTEYEYEAKTYALIKTTDANKHVWKYGYDAEGNKTSEVDPSKDEKKWAYDKKHDVETETTPEGETTTYKLNKVGEPETIERPIGASTQKTEFKYSTNGDLEEQVDPLKHATKYTYDTYGDKESEVDAESDETKWAYNADSQETEETNPRKLITKTERDQQGRPTKVTDPLKHVTEYAYDENGNLESETDGNKHTTKYEYNEENLKTKVTQPNKDIVETGYDADGQMTSHTDGNKHTWEYKRNALEQVTEEVDPLKRKTKRTYEKAGDLETLENPEKQTTTYKYDESDRLKSIAYSSKNPTEVTFEYNADSKVKKMVDETGTTENKWDKLDRLEEYKSGAGKVVKYEYDLDNQPTKITYPNKEAITREYDKDERLAKVTDWNKGATTFKYSPDSKLTAIVFPAAVGDEDTYAYDEADQVKEIAFKHGATSLGTIAYERDGDNQVKKTTTTVLPGPASSESTLDENNRLIEADKRAYAYDAANNPTELEGSGAASYGYNAADELEKGPEETYAYDEEGRRTKATPSKGPATSYGYDQANELTSVERKEEGMVTKIEDSYAYDGNGLRQSQTINKATTQLTWDTAEELPLLLADETNSYIYGPEGLPIEQIPSSGETLYLHHDQQGSTRLLTNEKGEAAESYAYTPYGGLEASSGSASTPLRYDGQFMSTDSGLIYLRARTYDPSTSQFLTIDPVLDETGEPYGYAGQGPDNASDPTGECENFPDQKKCLQLRIQIERRIRGEREWLSYLPTLYDERDNLLLWRAALPRRLIRTRGIDIYQKLASINDFIFIVERVEIPSAKIAITAGQYEYKQLRCSLVTGPVPLHSTVR